MAKPKEVLADALRRATGNISAPIITDAETAARASNVARGKPGAVVRLVLACSLAKASNPALDIRKPYSALGANSYSGRDYDEGYITPLINEYRLPCNSTTAFLTPALRTKNIVLTPDVNLGGDNPRLYTAGLELLSDVQEGRVPADDLLAETIRLLLLLREENRNRVENLLTALRATEATALPLSSEGIVALIRQHIESPQSSRLPVLVVAAAYTAAQHHLQERVLALRSHTAADEQTGALGDVEITLIDDQKVITSYEMKTRRVTIEDIDRALQKIERLEQMIDNYIFITTEPIEELVARYASAQYAITGGTEIVILDCIGFLRHFLHLFHRLRIQFLEAYQELLLAEPESAVRQELKETFLALRRAAESA